MHIASLFSFVQQIPYFCSIFALRKILQNLVEIMLRLFVITYFKIAETEFYVCIVVLIRIAKVEDFFKLGNRLAVFTQAKVALTNPILRIIC